MDVFASRAKTTVRLEIVLEQLPAAGNASSSRLEDLSPQERIRLAPFSRRLTTLKKACRSSSPAPPPCVLTAARLRHLHRRSPPSSLAWRQSSLLPPTHIPGRLHSRLGLILLEGGTQAKIPLDHRKVLIQTTGMFSQTPDDVLADVADRWWKGTPRRLPHRQGEQGDSLFVIVDGKAAPTITSACSVSRRAPGSGWHCRPEPMALSPLPSLPASSASTRRLLPLVAERPEIPSASSMSSPPAW
jgi:hypothetical protein